VQSAMGSASTSIPRWRMRRLGSQPLQCQAVPGERLVGLVRRVHRYLRCVCRHPGPSLARRRPMISICWRSVAVRGRDGPAPQASSSSRPCISRIRLRNAPGRIARTGHACNATGHRLQQVGRQPTVLRRRVSGMSKRRRSTARCASCVGGSGRSRLAEMPTPPAHCQRMAFLSSGPRATVRRMPLGCCLRAVGDGCVHPGPKGFRW
jgi:hypothetical protein